MAIRTAQQLLRITIFNLDMNKSSSCSRKNLLQTCRFAAAEPSSSGAKFLHYVNKAQLIVRTRFI
jgi:hypothetical protein